MQIEIDPAARKMLQQQPDGLRLHIIYNIGLKNFYCHDQ